MNRDDRFWVGVVVAGALGAALAVGPYAARWTPGAVWFAAAYPISVALGLTIDAAEGDGDLEPGALLGWALAVFVATLPVLGHRRRSLVWFRVSTVGWSVVSLVLFFVYGLGIAFIPLALAAWFSARWYRAQGPAEFR